MIVELDVGCLAKVCNRLIEIDREVLPKVNSISAYVLMRPIVLALVADRDISRIKLINPLRPSVLLIEKAKLKILPKWS